MYENSAKISAKLGPGLRGPLIAVLLLALSVALLGGSSRYDNFQFVILQPIAWIIAGFLILKIKSEDIRHVGIPASILLGLVCLIGLQLLPLPYAIWSELPGRDVIRAIDMALGTQSIRPLSMAPARTLNAFGNLAIPLAGLLAFALLGQRSRSPIVFAILAIALLHAAFAVLQVVGPGENWLYFYHGANQSTAVGLFANPNHAGVFAALNLVFIATLLANQKNMIRPQERIVIFAIYVFVFIMGILSGSRAGLLANIIALLASAVILGTAGQTSKKTTGRFGGFPLASIGTASVGVMIALAFILSDRLPAFDEFVNSDPMEDLRFALHPIVWEMAQAYFPFGSGVGTFEKVFYIYETDDILQPKYVNMAHNDWLQFIVEAGVFGAVLLSAFLIWMGHQIILRAREGAVEISLGLSSAFAIIAFASYIDYPLRAPLFQLIFLWGVLCATITKASRSAN